MSESVKRSVLSSGGLLALGALLGTGLLWLTSWHAEDYLKANQRQALLSSLNQVIPAHSYDNNLLDDVIQVQARTPDGLTEKHTVYRARQSGKPAAVAMTTVAPDGYSGDILILIGIHANGSISGVRILKHHETPGLGDAIDVDRSDWVHGFDDKSLSNPGIDHWKVRKDGGDFDQFSGATITPRAVIKAVRRCLEFYAQHQQALFGAPGGKDLELNMKEDSGS